jgi:uncharacterized membrane protein YsdA (DUF1294 family)
MLSIGIASLFLAVICGLAVRGILPLGVLLLYMAASLASAVAYAADKSAARTGRWRTAERTLHVLALVGGWPGALIAQRMFRHKSRKRSFRIVFLLTAAANCGGLLWFLWTGS